MQLEFSDTSSILTGATVVLIFAIVYHHIKTFSFWSSRGVKGPTPWPIVGTSIYYILRDRKQVTREWINKYGRTFGIYEGYWPVLLTADNQLMQHIYIKNFSSFTDRNGRLIQNESAKRWLLWSKGDDWANQRSLISPTFTSSKMKTIFKSMSDCVGRFTEMVDSRIKSSGVEKGGTKNAREDVFSRDEIMSFTLDVIAKCFFSIKLDTYRDKTSEFFKRAFAFATFDVAHFIFWRLTPTPLAKYFKIDMISSSKFEYFENLSQSLIDERRKNPTKARNDFIQSLLEAEIPETEKETGENIYSEQDDFEAHYNDQTNYKELERIHRSQKKRVIFRKFEDYEIGAQMTFFFLAGFETTSQTISFCFYELAHRPDIQEELHEELSSKANLLDQEQEGYSTLLSLKKLDAFISEILRLYSPLFELNRVVTAKEGVVLPTEPPIRLSHGNSIQSLNFIVQRDPEYWSNPLEFDLTRFYPENRHKIKPCTYTPFGVGPRNCVGMRFALLEVKLAVAKIVLKYCVSPGPNSQKYPPDFTRHAFFLQLKHTDFRLSPRC